MKIFLILVAMVFCTVMANLLLKLGVAPRPEATDPVLRLFNWRILLGLMSFAAGAGLYIVVLQWLPLNVAQSFAAAQFVAVILASRFILSEAMGAPQIAGIVLITSGIAIVAWSRQ